MPVPPPSSATPPPRAALSAPAAPGPGRDLEAGRLLAELAETTDDPTAFRRARDSGFASRALDRLDAAAAASGEAGLFRATRAAFGAEPASGPRAYVALASAAQRYLARLPPRSAHVTLLGELVVQIAFNARVDRDVRADGLERATVGTLDDADFLDPAISSERHELANAADGDWRAILPAAVRLARSFDAVAPRDPPSPPPGI